MFTTISDLSGEPSAWPLWDRAFTRVRPNGIIFVVDGLVDRSTFEYQKRAMQFFIDFLGVHDRSWLVFKGDHRKARDQLRAVMFLYNKMDIWAPQGYTIGRKHSGVAWRLGGVRMMWGVSVVDGCVGS